MKLISHFEMHKKAKSDNLLTAKYREIQSQYREEVLKEPCGYGPNKNSQNKYGNMLINGKETGSNFISEVAFKFAKEKVLEKQINKYLTIEEYRLFNNMLSSMPMCFNLFADLRELLINDQDEASRVIKEIFSEFAWIDKVIYVDVEFIPVPITSYTNDKTAFDAMILAEDKKGKKGLISIETKYTDLLGSNSSSNTEHKDQIIKDNKIFDGDLVKELLEKGYKQIHRNYLLTYIYANKQNFKYFTNIIISPNDDKPSVKELEKLKSHLLQKDESIMKISLEEIIRRGENCDNTQISTIMHKFKNRYI